MSSLFLEFPEAKNRCALYSRVQIKGIGTRNRKARHETDARAWPSYTEKLAVGRSICGKKKVVEEGAFKYDDCRKRTRRARVKVHGGKRRRERSVCEERYIYDVP